MVYRFSQRNSKFNNTIFRVLHLCGFFSFWSLSCRYFVIVYPLNSRIFKSRTKTMVLIALTWIIPTIVSTGMLHSEQQMAILKSDYGVIVRYFCSDGLTPQQRLSFILSVTSLFYVLPLCIITFTTVRIIMVLLRPIPELSETQSRGRFSQEESKRKVSASWLR